MMRGAWRMVGAAAVPALLAPAAIDAQKAAVRTLTEQEMLDMMVGSSIQATRTSNSDAMIRQVKEAFAKGRKFTMVDLDTAGDDWVIGTVGAVGDGGAWEFVAEDAKAHNLQTIADPTAKAIEVLRSYNGGRIDALVRVEAAAATLQAFLAASTLGVPVLDTCLSARARPETGQSIPAVHGVQRSGKSAAVTRWGDVLVLDNIAAPIRLEHLLRGLAVSSGAVINTASAGYTHSPMWRVPKGIEIFGPRHFGFDFDYVPIEQQMKLRPKF